MKKEAQFVCAKLNDMKLRHAIIGLIFFGGIIASICNSTLRVAAQYSPRSSGQPSSQSVPDRRLRLTPLRSEIIIQPGEAYKGSLTLKNTGKTTLHVHLSAEAFGVINENYDYVFKPDSPISSWVNFAQTDVVVDAGETYTAHYLIQVPIGAEPGGKYISLFAAAQPDTDQGITTVDRVGSLVYLTVPGNVTATGQLLSLSSPIIATDDFSWSATIRNSGSTHFRSSYQADLETLWNTPIAMTKDSALILPASIRLIQSGLDMPRLLGIYKVTYHFSLGDNPTATQTKLLIYAPLGQIIPGALLGLAIFFLISNTIRRFHSHHRKKSS